VSGGIDISPGVAASIASIGAISVITGNTSALTALVPTVGPLRPAQWSKPAITMITVPAPYVRRPPVTETGPTNVVIPVDANGVGTLPNLKTAFHPNTAPQLYVFDAVFKVGHSQPVVITQNPIQTGANITDHAFLRPARVTMGIGMSDVMDAYAPGMWVGNSSKSVSAFQVLDSLRAARIPLTVTTRLKTYVNMLIEDIRADDSIKTLYGLSAVIEFQQIFVASVATQGVSARTQTTDSSALGAVQPNQPSAGIVANNQLPSTTTGIPSSPAIQANQGTVNGAGRWSSNNTSTLPPADFAIGPFGLPVPN
jgi:hypothetical protein